MMVEKTPRRTERRGPNAEFPLMRAIVWKRYGPPEGLELQEVVKPTPGEDEVLVKVCATTVTAGDCELRGLRGSIGFRILVRLLMGPIKPRRKILGQELAGVVEAVGKDVSLFRIGDRVFGTTGLGFGAYAEYACLPERARGGALAIMPSNMTFEEAAAVPVGGLEALYFLRKAGNLGGQRILVNGAGGGIGTFAIQLGKYFGAEVTGVDAAEKLELLRSIGADRVVDYSQEDFTQTGDTYDVIFDVVGKSSFSATLAVLRDHGRYLLANPRLLARIRGFWTSARGRKKVIFGTARQSPEELDFLRRLIEAGRIRVVIDRRFPLESVPDAHRYFEREIVRGTVVITA